MSQGLGLACVETALLQRTILCEGPEASPRRIDVFMESCVLTAYGHVKSYFKYAKGGFYKNP